ncbi:hypothetical protein HPB48_002835 [Haemaphysalis longicornis]|uniref:BTB domain-containing protein n=1 Tax=Haemaphysalis longicornis TaxID=44386 RepID=A0A9J6FD40_HAELO|nr:hypothetical protein HPB48_002835 [Haemaphysalis longicornis]
MDPAAGGDVQETGTRKETGAASIPARRLFRDARRMPKPAHEVVAHPEPALNTTRRAREHYDVVFQTTDGAESRAHRLLVTSRFPGCGTFFARKNKTPNTVGSKAQSPPSQQEGGRQNRPEGRAVTVICVSDLSLEMLEIVIDVAYRVPLSEHVGPHNVREVLKVAETLSIAENRDPFIQVLKEKVVVGSFIGSYQLTFSIYRSAKVDRVWNDPQAQADRSAVEFLDLVKTVLALREMHGYNFSESCLVQPRVPKGILSRFGSWTDSASNDRITYNCSSRRWQALADQRKPRSDRHGVAVLVKLVYIVCGLNGRDYPSVACLDEARKKWTVQANINMVRCYVSVAVLDEHLGGFDGRRRTASCERYDPSRNQWGRAASMHEIQSNASAGAPLEESTSWVASRVFRSSTPSRATTQ